ncbi:NADH-quinone oxidoreductase subunit H [Collinsella tanakaei]|nr:NADH-quinone oxidoreductase subunit H [Collinsella tanakaei]
MALLGFLIAFPLVVAIALMFLRTDTVRDPLVIGSAVIIGIASIITAVTFMGNPTTFAFSSETSLIGNYLATATDLFLCGFVFVFAVRSRNAIALVLATVQLVISVWCGSMAIHPEDAMPEPMYIDTLSVIMVLIVGLVGSAICVYALGYMKDFQHHEEEAAKRLGTPVSDRRHQFIALMFLFLSAMFIIVTSDNMDWLVAGWEITTVCSFLMIGFTQTDEAKKSALLQINLNMVGGIAFHIALVIMHVVHIPLSINGLVEFAAGEQPDLMILPLMLLSVAGLTKAAQMPFHKWLLGAMVAPTPTSALLHSSTMVKAGVFLLVKLAPLYLIYPAASAMVVGIGGITFVLCSFLAISQSNAKRVLAYSTIANLGLISACAGVGTAEAVWAAIFLIIFHTVSKSVLFLCVGTVEHRIGSRNIEDMDGLFSRLPHLTRFMMLGIMGMFVAPFGMLISKWATLVSFAETGNVIFLILLAFGSAATFFFWAKWLGKLAGVSQKAENVEGGVHATEWAAIGFISALLVMCCVLLPVISQYVIGPYLEFTYNKVPRLIDIDNMLIMVAIVLFIAIVLLTPWGRSSKARQHVYLSGTCIDADSRTYLGSMGRTMRSTKRNWYLNDIFPEGILTNVGLIVCTSVLLMAFAACFIFNPGLLSGGAFLVEREVLLVGPGLVGILVGVVVFGVCAPIVGCLLDGLDRKVSARMQGRVGPKLLQPYYDVRKLLSKEQTSVNAIDEAYVTCALVFCILAGGMFISGSNLLMCVFLVTLATLFVIIAAYSSRSPWADAGADRECLQVMSYEPMLLIMTVGFFTATQSFDIARLFQIDAPIVTTLIPIFLGLLFILTIKLRKSPFDLSYSHHAHQELLKGITTEMTGRTLAKIEIMHWCESVLFLMWVGMFFIWDSPISIVVALAVVAITWFFEVAIDNNFARTKWQNCLKLAWLVALVMGVVNLFYVLVTPFI